MADASADTEKIFKRFDTDGDGRISLEELTNALHPLGSPSADEVISIMAEFDTDKNNYIDFAEFSALCNANHGIMKDAAMAFNKN